MQTESLSPYGLGESMHNHIHPSSTTQTQHFSLPRSSSIEFSKEKEKSSLGEPSTSICLACTKDLNSALLQEPLQHVNWAQLEKDRDEQTVRLFKEFAVRRRSTLVESVSALPSTRAHNATCTIHTREDNPKLHANNRSCSPEDRQFVQEQTELLKACQSRCC